MLRLSETELPELAANFLAGLHWKRGSVCELLLQKDDLFLKH